MLKCDLWSKNEKSVLIMCVCVCVGRLLRADQEHQEVFSASEGCSSGSWAGSASLSVDGPAEERCGLLRGWRETPQTRGQTLRSGTLTHCAHAEHKMPLISLMSHEQHYSSCHGIHKILDEVCEFEWVIYCMLKVFKRYHEFYGLF